MSPPSPTPGVEPAGLAAACALAVVVGRVSATRSQQRRGAVSGALLAPFQLKDPRRVDKLTLCSTSSDLEIRGARQQRGQFRNDHRRPHWRLNAGGVAAAVDVRAFFFLLLLMAVLPSVVLQAIFQGWQVPHTFWDSQVQVDFSLEEIKQLLLGVELQPPHSAARSRHHDVERVVDSHLLQPETRHVQDVLDLYKQKQLKHKNSILASIAKH